MAGIDTKTLADKIFAAAQRNAYVQYDELITAMVAALGNDGLEHLKALFVEWSNEPLAKPAATDRRLIGRGSHGRIYEDEVYRRRRELTVHIALQEIADAQGDVVAYIAQQPEKTHRFPQVAADIADRLLLAERADEALGALDRPEGISEAGLKIPSSGNWPRIATLEALGRADEAQADRWTWFEQSLNDVHLRAFYKRLPDFDDIEAEKKAFAYAEAFPDVHINSFLSWAGWHLPRPQNLSSGGRRSSTVTSMN